jgi:Region found in RelA / SpoT proteins
MTQAVLYARRELLSAPRPDPVSDLGYCDFDMADFPRFDFSNKDVRRAGEVISGGLIWTEETAPEIRQAFRIANNWRDAHAYPMKSVRAQINSFMRHQNVEGLCAARLKRMQAIRRKLRRPGFRENLSQIQDLGGCRAILPTISDVRRLTKIMRERSSHELWKEDAYIDTPKPDGYRSHHLRFKFREGSGSIYDGRRIEVQIRTELQHSWATTVEAVGLLREEGLKNHHGSPEWLRLFTLMSAEFAEAEGCRVPEGVPSHAGRVAEIRELEKSLQAYDKLYNLNYVFSWTDHAIAGDTVPKYYLIKFDNETKKVDVEPHYRPVEAVASYDSAEKMDNESGAETTNVVLVEADKIENLKNAYPNYFGDVQLFARHLGSLIEGRRIEEYTVRPQERVALPKPEKSGFGWWFSSRWRRWK